NCRDVRRPVPGRSADRSEGCRWRRQRRADRCAGSAVGRGSGVRRAGASGFLAGRERHARPHPRRPRARAHSLILVERVSRLVVQRRIMSKVFVNIAMSLDGYMAPDGMTMENPGYKNWGAKWGSLMAWLLNQKYVRENLKLGPGGETGPVNDLVRSTTERIGANVMGKRMFDQGELAWPEEAPFHTPVYVLTNEKREPWVRP